MIGGAAGLAVLCWHCATPIYIYLRLPYLILLVWAVSAVVAARGKVAAVSAQLFADEEAKWQHG